MKQSTTANAVLLGGLVAGTIDVGAAALINLANPVLILHFIASGLIGRAAFTGGLGTAVLGLVLQWLMSFIIAGIFVFAANAIPLLRQWWVAAGVAYGVPVFLVMTYVVAPLSAVPQPKHAMTPDKIVENLLAMFLFGVIVSYFASRRTR